MRLTSTYKSDRQRWAVFLSFVMFVTHGCAHFHAAYASCCLNIIDSPLFDFFCSICHSSERRKREGERGSVEEVGGSGVKEKPPERRNYSHLTTRLSRTAFSQRLQHALGTLATFFPFCICATYFTVDSHRQSHYFKSTVNNFILSSFSPLKILCRKRTWLEKEIKKLK